MIKRFLVAGALVAGLLMTVTTAPASAAALTKPDVPIPGVTLVRHGGPGGFHGFHGGGFHGGGFRGGGFHGGGFRGGPGRSFHFNGGPHIGHGGPHFGHHGHFGRGLRLYPGFYGYAPYYDSYYYDDDYYADDDCAWLRRKAVRTGSRYWWHRYRACRGDY